MVTRIESVVPVEGYFAVWDDGEGYWAESAPFVGRVDGLWKLLVFDLDLGELVDPWTHAESMQVGGLVGFKGPDENIKDAVERVGKPWPHPGGA